MAGTSSRPKLVLDEENRKKLESLQRSRSASFQTIRRAKILLLYSEGQTISELIRTIGCSRDMAVKCIDKALGMGIDAGLVDFYHRPKEPVIDDAAKAWVVSVACQQPKDLGYAAEVWSRRLLAEHVRGNCVKAGHPCLSRAAKATVHRILSERCLRPEKIRYYLEKRDPDFEEKMREVVMVYEEVSLATEEGVRDQQGKQIITVVVDEKPGVQALANTSPDLPPVPNKFPTIGRDHEYKRMGTASILAAMDLHDGHIIGRVEKRHRSCEFILLLKDLDDYYPEDVTIRIILDNHSSHTSKETRAFLALKPNRFVFVYTPKHGSWLNLAENLFGKMARTFLKHIRVQSWEELKERILRGINEINAQPVVFRWTKFGKAER